MGTALRWPGYGTGTIVLRHRPSGDVCRCGWQAILRLRWREDVRRVERPAVAIDSLEPIVFDPAAVHINTRGGTHPHAVLTRDHLRAAVAKLGPRVYDRSVRFMAWRMSVRNR